MHVVKIIIGNRNSRPWLRIVWPQHNDVTSTKLFCGHDSSHKLSCGHDIQYHVPKLSEPPNVSLPVTIISCIPKNIFQQTSSFTLKTQFVSYK